MDTHHGDADHTSPDATDADTTDTAAGLRSGDGPVEAPADTSGEAPVGGDETTEDELDADNAVEADTLKTLDPDNPPA